MEEHAVMLMNVQLSGTNVTATLIVLILLAVTTVSVTRAIKGMAEPVTILMSVQAVVMIVIGMLDVKIQSVVILVIVILVLLVEVESAVMSMNALQDVISVAAMHIVLTLMAVTTVSATMAIKEMEEPVLMLMSVPETHVIVIPYVETLQALTDAKNARLVIAPMDQDV